KRVTIKRHPLLDGREATFWHMTSTGNEEEVRIPELRRCERIRWILPMIRTIGTDRVRNWTNKRKNKSGVLEDRIVIALPDFSYIVILADRGNFVLLWTAYFVEYENQRQTHKKEYEAFVARQG